MREQTSFPDDGRQQPYLDPATVDRLLDHRAPGMLPLASVHVRVAELLEAARGPAGTHELAGEAAARAAFRAYYRDHPARRRPAVLSKLLAIKVAVAAVGALSVVGVAAATTDNLPGAVGAGGHGAAVGAAASAGSEATDDQVTRTARLGLCEAIKRPADDSQSGPAADALATLAGDPAKIDAYCAEAEATARGGPSAGVGPDAGGPAATGLCRAYQAGRGGEHGGKDAAVAFAALVRAAGGADKIEAYCGTGSSARQPGSGTRPSSVPSSASAPRHRSDAPASPSGSPEASPRSRGPATRPSPAPTAPPGSGRPSIP
jgi:hypothetical protein